MTTKHTPGWRLGGWHMTEEFRWIEDGPIGEALGVAKVYGHDKAEADKHARLIAVAPEMYEALRTLYRAVEEKSEAAIFMHMLGAKAALAKAEGRET